MDMLNLEWTHSNQINCTHSTAEVTGVFDAEGWAI